MKLTKTHVFLTGAAIGAIIVGVIHAIITSSVPKDTPIVIVGGSIHHDTAKADNTGWLPQTPGASYLGIVHRDGSNNNGIDALAFNKFVDGGGNSYTGPAPNTNGWAIRVTDATTAKAVNVCSDTGCSASSDLNGSARCPPGYNRFGPVSVSVVDSTKSRLQEKKKGGIINELRYHNKSGDCDGNSDNEGNCDMLTTMRVDTCSPLQSQTVTCSGGGCSLTIGKSN